MTSRSPQRGAHEAPLSDNSGMNTTMPLAEELERLAKEATPGPWHIRALENFGWNVVLHRGGDKFDIERIAKTGREADADLIVALHYYLPAILSALRQEGHVLVPREPTEEMLDAAVDTDAFKLGDLSPLGIRYGPQELFRRAYAAMLSAVPGGGE